MGLKEIYYKIEDKYYALIEWLANNGLNLKPLVQSIESKGIPSLPLFTALLLIIVGGAYLYTNPALLQGLGGPSTVSIRVQSASSEPLADALVTITGASINQSMPTGQDGVASFSGISAGVRLRITVSKDGFSPLSRDFVAGGSLAPFILRTGNGQQITLLVTTAESSPVSQAQVSYVVDGETRNTQTSQQGIAQLSVPIGTPVSITVSAQGFDTVTQSFTPDSPGYQHQLTLNSSLGSIDNFGNLARASQRVPSPNDDATTDSSRSINLASDGVVTVVVSNSSGSVVSGANVVLFNNADQSQLGTVGHTDSNGTASFTSIPTGIQAYVAVDADGYVSQVSAPKVTQAATSFSVTMPAVSNLTATNLTITLSDDGQPATTVFSGLELAVITESPTNPQRLPSAVTGTGRTRTIANLPAGQSIYLSVYTPNHVRWASEAFTLAAGVMPFQVNLTKKTADNAVDLRVNLVDFYNAPLLRGTVTALLSTNSHLLLPNVSTTSSGSGGAFVLKNMPVAIPITVRATNGSYFGEGSLTVSPDNSNVTISVIPVSGDVNLNAVNVFDNSQQVQGASFTVTYSNAGQSVILAGCGSNSNASSPTGLQNGVCHLSLASAVTYTVIAHAPGYFDKAQTFTLSPNALSTVQVVMVPATSTDIMPASPQIMQIEGGTETPVTATDPTGLGILEAGKTYEAVFNVVFKPNTNGTGVYLRLGDDSSSTSSDNAVIFKGFPLDDSQMINSGNFILRGGTSYPGNCDSQVAPDNVGIFKWLDAFVPSDKYNGDSSRDIKVRFIVTKPTPLRLNVSYRAYAIFNDGTYSRSPVDSEFGPLKETPAKRECSAAVNKTLFKVASVADQVVQCTNQACLTLSFSQGQRSGGEGFQASPAVTSNQTFLSSLFLHYSVLDFNPNFDDGTQLKFQTDRNFITVLRTADQASPDNAADYSADTVANSYTVVSKTSAKVSGLIETHPTLQANPSFPISLSYGDKATLSTDINLVGLPQQVSALAALPQHYVLLYSASSQNSSNDQLNLLLVDPTTGVSRPANSLDFQVDPLLPADALILLFNFSNAPCEQLTFNLFSDLAPGCFEQVNDPSASLSLPDEYKAYGDKMLMLKYDASTDACKYYSKNPNAVKITKNASVLRAVSACTQKAIEIPLNIGVNPALISGFAPASAPTAPSSQLVTQFSPAYRAVTMKEKAWEEAPVPDLGVDGSYIHVLYNNRQYSKDNYVPIFQGSDEATASYFKVSDNEVILPVQSLKPIVTHAPTVSQTPLLGTDSNGNGFEPDPLFTVLDAQLTSDVDASGNPVRHYTVDNQDVAVTFKNQPDSMKATKEQLLNVLSNTVFRRRQYCNPPHPCPFGMFPYSAFVDIRQKPIVYHLAGDVWTGKFGSGSIGPSSDEFSFYGLTGDKCLDSETGRKDEGLYDYYWQYSIDPTNGDRVQLAKYKPVGTTSQDYDTFSCSQPLKLCGKLSINGGQCIRNCGDGWYYGAYPGVTSKTCSGNNFKVEDVRHSSKSEAKTLFNSWHKNIPNALMSCLAQEYSAAYVGCTAGNALYPGVGGLVGTQLGGFIGGQAYDAILADKVNSALNIDPAKGDVPGFASFLGKWAQACSYAGTALDIVNSVNTLKQVAALGSYHCPNAWNLALSKCFCLETTGTGHLLSGNCAAEKALRSVVSSAAFRDSREHISTIATNVKQANDQKATADAALKPAADNAKSICNEDGFTNGCSGFTRTTAGSPISVVDSEIQKNQQDLRSQTNPTTKATDQANIDKLNAYKTAQAPATAAQADYDRKIAEAKASGLCTTTQADSDCAKTMNEIDSKLGTIDTAVNAVCGPLLTVAAGTLVLGSAVADAPARGYIAINDAGHTDFGGTLGITGPDVDCVDNTDTSRKNLDVWMDLDFSSLRVKEGQKVACMDKNEIATWAPKEGEAPAPATRGVDPDNKQLNFYITSRNQ